MDEKSSKKACQSASPNFENCMNAEKRGSGSRNWISPNDKVPLVTTASNCIHKDFTSEHTFAKYDPQYNDLCGYCSNCPESSQIIGIILADTRR